MAAKYPSLPGTYIEWLDGNLRLQKPINGPVTLVIGTSYKGRSNAQYLLTDTAKATQVFGSNSPLLQAASLVKAGGADNVILYRIGGKAAELKDIFGTDTSLMTSEESVEVNSQLKLYVGPQPSNPAAACVIVFKGSVIVYSNVPGAQVDLGYVTVDGFDDSFALSIGTPTAPVALNQALSNVRASATLSTIGDGTTTNFVLPSAITGTTIDSVKINGSAITTGFSLVDGGLSADSISFTTAPLAAATIEVVYSYATTIAGASFIPGENNITSTLKKYYELVDAALRDLESTVADTAYVDRAILDAANIADGSTATDRLEYLNIETIDDEPVYTWSTSKFLYQDGLSTTTILANADLDDNGQPVVVKTYNEVNFAHRIATWAHFSSENEQVVLPAIATSVPDSQSTVALARFYGKLPVKDADGIIIQDGTGLLGNKFMSGSTTRERGFFLTDNGFPDGNPVYDSNQAVVDIGKFISIVPATIVSTIPGVNKVVSFAPSYAGIVSTLLPGESTTNMTVGSAALPGNIKKSRQAELVSAGYVILKVDFDQSIIVSGSIPTAEASDYDYLSTTITMAGICRNLRRVIRPYIGKGLNEAMIAALNTAIEQSFARAVKDGWINKYSFALNIDPSTYSASLPFKIVPPFELRNINASGSLAFDLS